MTRLSELVEFRNKLLALIEQLDLEQEIIDKRELVKNIDILQPYTVDTVANLYTDLLDQSHGIINETRAVIKNVEHDIDVLADQLFNANDYVDKFSFRNFNYSFGWNSNKDYFIPEEIKELIKHTIKNYCNWHHPGLNIYPKAHEWVDSTIMCDPLYLVANCTLKTHPILPGKPFLPDRVQIGTYNHWQNETRGWGQFPYDSLLNIVYQYPDIYQRRLRLYPAKDLDFSLLPQEKFGFVLSWGFANFITKDITKKLLEETFKLLKPGGVFMMSYNNCDLSTVAKIAEEGNLSYAHARLIKEFSDEIGFEVVKFNDIETGDGYFTHVSWVELRKPGVLKTVKALQAMGEIISK